MYYQYSQRKSNRKNIFINIAIYSIVFIALAIPLSRYWLHTLDAIHYLQYNISQQYQNWWGQYFITKTDSINLSNQINQLKIQLYDLRALDQQNQLLSQENQNLREILNLKAHYYANAQIADIILRNPDTWHKQLTINKGSNQNLKVGMIALSHRGIVGQIQKVMPNQAIIQTMGSGQIRLGCQLGRTGLQGVLFSDYNNYYANLRFIPIGSDIQKGDQIYTTAFHSSDLQLYPPHLPIGTVIAISNSHNNTELMIKVKLHENLSNLNQVIIK